MIVPSIKELAKFVPQRFTPVGLNQNTLSKTMVVGLEPGLAISVNHSGSDLTIRIIEGQVRTIVPVIVSPPPTEADHHEQVEHFKKGTWR